MGRAWVRRAGRALLLAALSLTVSSLSVFSSALAAGGGWVARPAGDLAAEAAAAAVPVAGAIFLLDRLVGRPPRPDGRGGAGAAGGRAARGGLRAAPDIPSPGARGTVLAATLIFACWAFWLVAYYPGSMNFDTYYQITQCYPASSPVHLDIDTVWAVPAGYRFSDHHPIFDTLVYGAFARASEALTGSWDPGLFALAALQCAGTAAAFAYALGRLRAMGAPACLCRGALAFICLVPAYGNYSSTVLKDMLHSGIYVLWLAQLLEVARTRGRALKRPRLMAATFAVACLLALTRKTGLYVVAPTLALLAACYRAGRARLALQALGVALLMWGVLPNIVFPALNVAPGGRQEAMGALFQQTARFARDHPGEETADERAAIDRVLGYGDLAARYVPQWADPVKYGYNGGATAGDLTRYLEAWAAQGARHPGTYAEAVLANVRGFFDPADRMRPFDVTFDRESGGTRLISRPRGRAGMREAAGKAWGALAGAPVAGLALCAAAYTLWVPALAVFSLARRGRARWLPLLAPTLLTCASLLLSPMADPRYALPLVYAAPLTVCLLGAAARGGADAAHRSA